MSGPVVVTGASGFVGRHLVSQLSAERIPVRLALRRVDRDGSARQDGRNIELVETGDLAACPPQKLAALVGGASAIVHLAGRASTRGRDELAYKQDNLETTRRLCAAAEQGGVRRFIFLSSIFAVTGPSAGQSIADTTTPAPNNVYGTSKLAAEERVAELQKADILAISLRPPLVIGAEAGGNWRQFMRLAASGLPLPFAGVRNRRSYCSVDTLTSSIWHLLRREWPLGASGSYALADSGSISLPETLSQLRAGMGIPRRLFPAPSFAFSALAALPGLGSRISALTGDQVVDASRFFETFGIQRPNIETAVRDCGASYAVKRNAS